jgi:hypothetical protein
MKWLLILPVFLFLFGACLWQHSVLTSLREREKSLHLSISRRAVAPPIVVSVAAQPPPDAKAIARSLMVEYAALLPPAGRRSNEDEAEALSRQEEDLAAQSQEILRQVIELMESSGLTPAQARPLRQAVLRALAISDPASCVRFAATRPHDSYLASSLSGWLRKWVMRDAAGAQEWFDTMKAGSGFKDFAFEDKDQLKDNELSLRVQLLCGRAAADPAAFDFHELEGLSEKALFRFSADTPNGLKNAGQRELYARRIWSEVTDLKTAEKLLSLAASVWSRRIPFAEFQALTNTLQGSGPITPEKQKVLSGMRAAVFQYGGGGPDETTFKWALQGADDPALRELVVGRMISGWFSADYNLTGEFLNSLPAGPDRDLAAANFARKIMAIDEAASLNWAASISDPVLRTKTEASLRKVIDDDKRRFPSRK